MIIDETIKHCEEVAEKNEKQASFIYIKEGNPYYENYVECAKEHRQLAEWLKELKSLKEKDEAKEVFYEGDGYADGAMVYDTAFCPSCNYEFDDYGENWECNYCPKCGQRLRWEE